MSVASKLRAGIPQSLLDELEAEGGIFVEDILHGLSHFPKVTQVQPRRAVLAMPEYHPPLAGRHALRLDFNENTFAPSPRVFAALQKLTSEGLTIYPERQPTERIVAAHFGLAPEQVMLTNGVDEAIHLLACAFLDEGDEALVCTPSFFMYDVSISMMTSGLVRVQADDTLAFPFERFLRRLRPAPSSSSSPHPTIPPEPPSPASTFSPSPPPPRKPSSWSTKPTSTSTAKPPWATPARSPTCSSREHSRKPTASQVSAWACWPETPASSASCTKSARPTTSTESPSPSSLKPSPTKPTCSGTSRRSTPDATACRPHSTTSASATGSP